MIIIREVKSEEKKVIDEVVDIHLKTFQGFFLTFMGRGFLKQMYLSYCEHEESGLLVAEEDNKPLGFLAYSGDFSALFKDMINRKIVLFAWYSLGAFFRKPSAFMHIIRAFLKPNEVKRDEKYVELASIGVDPSYKMKGIGTLLINELKSKVDFSKYEYIALETDAINNDAAIRFYEKNGFIEDRIYETNEGRKMIEFHYKGDKR